MSRWVSAGIAAVLAGGVATGVAIGQPVVVPADPPGTSGSGSASPLSSPFARWFGRGDPVENSPVDLQFRVSNGGSDLERRLRNTSLLTGALAEGRITGQDILAAARADYVRLLSTLYDAGYYSAVIDIRLDGIDAAGIAALDAPDVVRQVVVDVRTGEAFRYSRADIAPLAPGTELPTDYARGRTARTSDMRAAAQAGVAGWRDVGHAKAAVAADEIVADHAARMVDSRIALDPGPAVTFGRLIASGNSRLRTERLYALAGFPDGERFDPESLDEMRRRLRRTGVFSAITLEEAEYLGPDDTLDVRLTVVEQPPRRIGAGFEISSTDGAMISGYWMHRNLFRGAERLRVDGRLSDIGSGTSGRDYSLSVRLERPATFDPDLTAYVEATAERLDEEDYDQDLGTLGAGLIWLPTERLSGDARLEYRRSRVDDETGTTDFSVVALPLQLTWDRRDEPTNAKRGFWLNGWVTPFGGLDNSTGSGVRALAEGRAYRSFGENDRFTLAGRARAGSIWGPEIVETPREYLFYSGGGGSVRGHPFQSLGVEVISGPEGEVKTGGMSVANLTGEVRFQVRQRIGLAAFADAGKVWADSGFGGVGDWHAGAGLGVRYDTPVGPLRLDVAGPVGGGADTASGVQVYLGLGQAF